MQIIRDISAITPEPCVATIGFFDGVHAGHRYLIQQVKEIAAAKGLRSALVTFPVHPRKVMNVEYRPELLTTPEEKISLLADIGVDYCLMLDFTPEISRLTAREFMTQLLKERYQVKYLVIGYDHRFGHNRSEGFEDYVRYGKEIGIEVIRAKAYTSNIEIGNEPNIPVSSSLIRKLLHEGEVSLAAHLAHRRFKRNARARAGLLKNHAECHVPHQRRIVPCLDGLFDGKRQFDDVEQLLLGPFVGVDKIFFHILPPTVVECCCRGRIRRGKCRA